MSRTPLAPVILSLAMLAATASAEAASRYEIDPGHSFALFEIEHLGVATAHGRFNDISGEFVHDPKDESKSRIQVVIAADSVDTNSERRDKHLRSPDFFDANQFPEIRFVSTKIEPIAAGDLEVTGDLTLHGVTRPITVRADAVGEGPDPWGGYRKGYDAELVIQRSEFGMDYMPKALGDDVKIRLSLEGIKKK